jgi:hypothetical protein
MVSAHPVIVLFCAAFAGSACAGSDRSVGPKAPRAGPLAAAAAPDTGAPGPGAALRFELNGRRFPSPLINAIIGGRPTTLLVDTGATHHVVAAWLATELSLRLTSAGDAATDHAGKAIPVARLEDASFSLPGWGAAPVPVQLVIPVPDILERMGIGGFLAPQALSSEGRAVVLDLRAGSMTDVPIDEALRRLGASAGAATLTALRACGDGSVEGTQLVAQATIEGIAAEVKIDSGATHSSLFADRGVGKRLSGRAQSSTSAYAASGRYTVPTLQGAQFKLGAFEITADVDILPKTPKSPCASDGYLGMDVLRSCVLVLAGNRSALRCLGP